MELLSLLESVLGQSEPRSKGNYRFKCPLPGCSSVRKRLEIKLETDSKGCNKWKCWVCNKGGNTLRSLFRQASADSDKISLLDSLIKPNRTYTEQSIIQVSLELPSEYKTFENLKKTDFIGKLAKRKLIDRGFSNDDILKYSIGYCDVGRYSNRIIFPSYDSQGLLNFFVGRTILDDDPIRYMLPESPRKNIIPFELYINWNVPIILCEGFFDAKAIARNAIPLLEKGITEALMGKLMLSSTKKIYIALDQDAMKEALDHAEMLINNGKKVYLVELGEKDPDKMGFEDFTRMIQTATSIPRDKLIMKKLKSRLYE